MTVISEEQTDLADLEHQSDDSSDVVDMNGDGIDQSENQNELEDLETESAGMLERGHDRDFAHGNPRASILMQNRASFVSSTQHSFILSQQ